MAEQRYLTATEHDSRSRSAFVINGPSPNSDPIIRGESEPFWNPYPPFRLWPFRCRSRHDIHGPCRRERRHEGKHYARGCWWTDETKWL